MARAISRDATRNDLAAVRDEISKDTRVFIVDAKTLFGAEPAYLPPSRPPTSRSPIVTSAWATARPPALSSWASRHELAHLPGFISRRHSVPHPRRELLRPRRRPVAPL